MLVNTSIGDNLHIINMIIGSIKKNKQNFIFSFWKLQTCYNNLKSNLC